MPSGTNRIALAQAQVANGKKGKSAFNAYARKVTGNINSSTTGKEDLCKK